MKNKDIFQNYWDLFRLKNFCFIHVFNANKKTFKENLERMLFMKYWVSIHRIINENIIFSHIKKSTLLQKNSNYKNIFIYIDKNITII